MSLYNRELDAPSGASTPLISDVTHPGTFFELDSFTLERARQAGYEKIGVGIALLNSAGEILVIDHKGSSKLVDHTLGITSETVTFDIENPGRAEPIIRTIGRCLLDEVSLNPVTTHVTTKLDGAYTLTDWPVGNRSLGQKLLGINVALLLDGPAAERVAHLEPNQETYGAYFVDREQLTRQGWSGNLRPGTQDCLHSLGEAGLLEVLEISEARLVFPDDDYSAAGEDIRLSTL